MFVDCLYEHVEENHISYTRAKKAEGDALWLFFRPDKGEFLPFPNGRSPVPFDEFVRWFNERTAASEMLTDEQALTIPTLYDYWDENQVQYYDGTDGMHAQSRVRGQISERLYKCNISHTSQIDWPPEKTPAMWTVIDEGHAGTIDDPIPAARGMEYVYGLYYLDGEDGNTYLCTRTGETEGGTVVLQFMPHELVGQYFELVQI